MLGKMYYIRHAPTLANIKGNVTRNYSSYDILDFDIDKWKQEVGIHVPKSFKLLVSPAKRCIQTAERLFPSKGYKILDSLSEFDIRALGDLKFWEVSEDQFNEIAGLTKEQIRNKIRFMLTQVSLNVNFAKGENAVLIGHGFYGRLMKDVFDGENTGNTVFDILNSKNFSFRNLDMMKIENDKVEEVYRFTDSIKKGEGGN